MNSLQLNCDTAISAMQRYQCNSFATLESCNNKRRINRKFTILVVLKNCDSIFSVAHYSASAKFHCVVTRIRLETGGFECLSLAKSCAVVENDLLEMNVL